MNPERRVYGKERDEMRAHIEAHLENGAELTRTAQVWIDRMCDECGQYSPVTVELGDDPDCRSCESSAAMVCVGCLRKALALCDAEVA